MVLLRYFISVFIHFTLTAFTSPPSISELFEIFRNPKGWLFRSTLWTKNQFQINSPFVVLIFHLIVFIHCTEQTAKQHMPFSRFYIFHICSSTAILFSIGGCVAKTPEIEAINPFVDSLLSMNICFTSSLFASMSE